MPAIRTMLLFGSLASGTPTPSSDADILVIVDQSPHTSPRDRIPELLRAMAPLPCPLDLFIATAEEFERARQAGAPLVVTALATGLDLLS